MKILTISHLYPSNKNSSKGLFVKNQTEALEKLGNEVAVVVPVANIKPTASREIGYLSLSNPGLLINDHFLANKISKKINANDYQIILAHTVLPDGATAIRLGRRYNIPTAIYIHGADVQQKSNKPYLKRKIIDTLKGADLVLVNSQKTQKLTDALLGEKKAQIVYLGINKSKIFSKKNGSKTLKLLTVGNLVPEKGIDYAVRAINELNHGEQKVEYDIIGSGPELENLKKLAGDDKRINFLGSLPNEAVHRKMAEADVFLLPSHNEAFGIVYLESLWQKTPIIGCKDQGVEDIIACGNCGILVKPRDTKSIKEAIVNLSDSESRTKMGEIGHEIVEENFLWDNVAKDLNSILKKATK